MTAILAIRKRDSIELLTDSAAICGGTGKVLYFARKQIATAIPNCAIGATGATRTCFEFGRRIQIGHVADFDALVGQAEDLWRQSVGHVPHVGLQALALAGWSVQRGRLELWSIDSDENRLYEGEIVATGPTEEVTPVLAAFAEEFEADLESFTAGDGIALFERLRRYPRQFAADTAPAVGGEIYQTTIKKTGTSTQVIHRWPDRVGEKVRLESHSESNAESRDFPMNCPAPSAFTHDFDQRAAKVAMKCGA